MSVDGARHVRERASAKEDTAQRPLLGRVIADRFRVLAHIGSGGMADVYEVEHTLLGRRLAMKVLRHTQTSNPMLAKRFAREARAASRLRSEHVVSIHDYGELPEGHPYFVMELLSGRTLRDELNARGNMPPGRVANLAIDVCLGLDAAHGAGLVHRDLKPENLWLTQGDDGRERCVLLDFGVARFEGTHSTGDGVLVGTARYMSPEQIAGERAPGPRSDLFSLGVIIHECLSGVSPFAADSLERTLFRVLRDDPKPIHELAPDTPEELSHVLQKALAKEPDERFESALAFAACLRAFAVGARTLPVLAAPTPAFAADATLAEDEPVVETGEVSVIEVSKLVAPAAPRSSWRTVATFSLGLALGGGAFWVASSREHVTPSATAPQLAVAAPSAPIAPIAAETSSSVAPGTAVPSLTAPTPLASGSTRLTVANRPSFVRAASPRDSAARPALPRPDFDGRNPYLP